MQPFYFIIEKLKITIRFILTSLGINLHKKGEDRLILEKVIFPELISNKELRKILFVGCAWYTKAYNERFKNKIFYTIDINPKNKRYGSKRHIVDSLENISNYFQEGEIDLIICNGVWGWGLNDKNQSENAFGKCYKCLRNGGIFLLGWNDIPEYRPFPLDDCKSLRLFKPFTFNSLSASQYLTSTPDRHTYNFYIK